MAMIWALPITVRFKALHIRHHAHRRFLEPQRGPTRHQRAAQISAEVRALNRDVPSLGPSQPPNDSADFAVGPQGTGELGIPGRMGENMPPQREGIYGQGASRVSRDEEVALAEGGQTKGVRDPSAGVEDPSRGGAAVLGGEAGAQVSEQELAKAEAEMGVEQEQIAAATTAAPSQSSRVPAPGMPFRPRQPTLEDLTHSGNNASTIAAGNFEGVLADRLHQVASPGSVAGGTGDIDALARKLLRGRLTSFASQEQKDAVLAKADEIRKYEQHLTSQQTANLDPDRKGKEVFAPLPEGVRKSLVDKMVRGVYDSEAVLGGEKYKQPVLNTVARMSMMNGTYLGIDAERLLQKVRSLLPIAAPARKPQPPASK